MDQDPNPHVVQDTDMSMWDDPSFSNLYDNLGAAAESPFDGARLFDMSAATVQADSPSYHIKTDDGQHAHSHQPYNSRSLVSSRSAESSSQDSSSETSGRKRKNTSATSESPPGNFDAIKLEQQRSLMHSHAGSTTNMASLHSLHNLSLEQDFANQFGSAASSPGGQPMDLLDRTYSQHQYIKAEPPAGTVEPSNFFFGSSTASPASVKASQTQEASPGAMFNNPTPSSDGTDMFNANQMWNNSAQNPAWNTDYAHAFASPGALAMTPSPVLNAPKPELPKAPTAQGDRIPLNIAPIPAKSRVETQINIRLTMDYLPPRVKMLHLPTHTIAKAKLLAKEVHLAEDTLELYTMLVCTSAMNQPHLREKAMNRAALQDNAHIQVRGQGVSKKAGDEEVDENDKPANGGEVRICSNCINRERKRAARKKLKKEEEQAHWEKYETERVIVFNTNEYKPWQDWQQSPAPKDNNVQASDFFHPPETAMQVVAPMRIACYCRHQNEKDGFQVIFTIKDNKGNVVAQDISDSILITDDHKTHPMASVPGQAWYDGQFPAQAPFTSHSMVDLHSHMPAMSVSKSTGNLQSLGYGAQNFHQPSNMHMQNFPPSQATTPGTMTPRNLSRPGSPNSAGQAGPSKKRKSSSAHRRIPSTLTMTKMENQQMAQPTAQAPFSPTSAGFLSGNNDPSYITMPHSASRAHFHTGPSTPIETTTFPFSALNRTNSMDGAAYQAFYSAPSSAHQSRAPSPVLVGPNLAAFQRQQAHGGASAMPNRQNPFAMSNSAMPNAMSEPDRTHPIINKVTPSEGPPSGGTEVSVYGSGFAPGMEVMFGDQVATATTYWGEKALCCVLPPGQNGIVPVAIAPSPMRQYSAPPPGQTQVFNYVGKTSEMQTMEMALRYYSQKETGRADQWQALAQGAANAWMSQGSAAASGLQTPQGAPFEGSIADMRYA
ncbi:hypothetical protein D6D01_03640 [Aureobasidium pullulans]|uniref:IPT/TIG domain-containing protein n=1 Tax=Aureobasidium pullulans TaxID=5580 RepID=A0A4S9LJB7_AURPU|nr:hypothetical protein D6D01_03640 [Aureobasidium pullulans]